MKKHIELYKQAFSEDSDKYVDYFFSSKIKNSKIIYDKQDNFDSLLYLIDKEIISNNVSYPIYYIVAAATWLEKRGKGIFASVMKNALEYLKDINHPFVFLYPFSHKYYKQYSFITSDYTKEILIKYTKDNTISYKKSTNIKDIQSIYNQFFAKYSIYLDRDKTLQNRLEEIEASDGSVYIVYKNNKPVAYFILTDVVEEAISLVDYKIFNHVDILNNNKIYMPIHNTYYKRKENTMMRMVDIKKAIMIANIDTSSDVSFVFEIKDDILGDSTYLLDIKNNQLTCKEVTMEKQFSLNVEKFNKIYCGIDKNGAPQQFIKLFSRNNIFMVDKF